MKSKNKIIWTLKELTTLLRQRQLNKFDCNFGVSGKRGDGKSTLLFKIFHSFKKDGFRQKKHQVYSQEQVVKLLANQSFSFCWDDEAINSGYKRNFQSSGQKSLIQVVTNYRDNYNIYGSALPFFYSLDKDLRELMFLHIHIIERGVAVILLPLADQIHSSDPWDTKANIKVEEKEYKRLERNPTAKFRYQRFTTFGGYLFFGKMTPKQEEIYKKIKQQRREEHFNLSEEKKELTLKEKVLDLLLSKKLTKDGLIQICLINNKKYSNFSSDINKLLKDRGEPYTLSHYLRLDEPKKGHSKSHDTVIDLVPRPSA